MYYGMGPVTCPEGIYPNSPGKLELSACLLFDLGQKVQKLPGARPRMAKS
jgi:hypothetical protein